MLITWPLKDTRKSHPRGGCSDDDDDRDGLWSTIHVLGEVLRPFINFVIVTLMHMPSTRVVPH